MPLRSLVLAYQITKLEKDGKTDSVLSELNARGNMFCLQRYPAIISDDREDSISYWKCRANYTTRAIVRLHLLEYYSSDQLNSYIDEFYDISDSITNKKY